MSKLTLLNILQECYEKLENSNPNIIFNSSFDNYSTINYRVKILVYNHFDLSSLSDCSNIYLHISDYDGVGEYTMSIDIYKGYFYYKNKKFDNFENLFPLTEDTMFQYSTLYDTSSLTMDELNFIMSISLDIPIYEAAL